VRRAPDVDAFLAELEDEAEIDARVAPLVRRYLGVVREYLLDVHRESRSGRVVNEANSDVTDRLLRRLFMLAEQRWIEDGNAVESGLCVVAVGGYARREMSIHSDVDLLVLYRRKPTPYVTRIAECLQYWLWDAGVTVGCATRTIRDTVKLGRQDVTVRTAVLTARFLCGDGEFFHEFADKIRTELLPDVEGFIREQSDAMVARHSQYGESLFLLQPNLKEGAGGLRDYHTAYWVARGAQPSVRDLDDFLHFGLLTDAEMADYRNGLEFLWMIRNELHLQTKRADDRMSFELQEQVAQALGYAQAGDEAGELPVERFMRDYYRHARAIQSYSELVIEQCIARSGSGRRRRKVREVEEGFRVCDGQLEVPHSALLRERPVRLLSVFRVAQMHDVPLSRITRRLVRENLDLVDDRLRRDPAAAALFFEILEAERRVMRSLMAMNEVGLLAAFLPEWEHVVNRWQHVIYHTYTVDVHSIFLVEELRRLWRGKHEQDLPELTELMRSIEDRAVLFMGCLLHDIGKGFGGGHSAKGVERSRPCIERLGLRGERAERVIFLVQHHLLMSHLAQRRDLSDPRLILDFAKLCGDRINLRNLYLMTFADIRASSRDAWTPWKGQLLRELFERTAEFLEVGATDEAVAFELIEARVEVRQEGAANELLELGVSQTEIDSFFEGMPRRYFVSHTPRQIARHARVALRYSEDRPFTSAFREMRGDFTEFILCTRDVHGLYGMVAGTLTACALNILGSHVYTTRSGLALEVYRLSTPKGGPKELELAWKELERRLEAVLTGKVAVESLLNARRRPAGVHAPLAEQPPIVAVSSEESEFYTIADVSANDRIGLLYDLASTIGALDLEVYISKAATIRDQVTDTFYLKDRKGAQIRDPAMLDEIRSRLYQAALGRPAERPRAGSDEEPRGPRDPGSEAPEPATGDDTGMAPSG
jgi:[protein-PII] uridylyltransferase